MRALPREIPTRFLSLALLVAGLAPAQDSPPGPRTQNQPGLNPSSDDSGAPDSGAELPNAGPSLFSEDRGLLTQRSGKLIDLELFAEISGVYDSGLAAAPPQNGSVKAVGDYGVETGVGATVSRRWRHTKLSIEYRGKFRDYATYSLFDGSDQFLDLEYSQLVRRHLALNFKEIAGTTANPNGAFSYLPLSDTSTFALPTNELFNNRTNYAESRVDLVWQESARLTFDIGGDGFIVRRDALALAGLNGYGVRAGVAYRLTRRQTVGASYEAMNFDFEREYGGARLQTAALTYSIALGRNIDLQIQAGGSRIDSDGLTLVTLDPSIAAIIGQGTAVVTFSRVLFVPLEDVRLVRRFHQASFNAGYSSGVSPGNGLYLTSRQNTASGNLSYTAAHRITGALNAGYSRLATLGQSLPPYTNIQAGASLYYRLSGGLHLRLRYDYRHYSTQYLLYKVDSNRISLGMAYSPGAARLAIW